jgi:peptidoglycan/xylan/chitin deacetylase (PgdA/CDA1 family)
MGAIATIRHAVRDVVLDALPSTRVIRRGPGTARRVALTFDDGPQPLTGALLDTLDAAGAAGTFFLMGDLSSDRPEMLREYVRRGHQIAGHGWNHKAFPTLSRGELRAQLHRTASVIGPQPTSHPWMRPPYGAISARVVAQMLAEGFSIALWSFESRDHEITDADALVARVTGAPIAPGDVLLFHEGYQHTVDAMPRIVAHLHEQGFECVTMADLLQP